MFRKPVFWIVFILISTSSVIFALKFFPQAFPLVSLELKMDRQTALVSAENLAENYGWGPKEFRQAATFGVDRRLQNFVELEAGGVDAFRKIIKEGLYSPYTWRIRHFKEGEVNETLIRFTPNGKPYGFREKLPEDEPGASLTPNSAQVTAETTAKEKWHIDLTQYELVEKSQEVRPGGRIDHTFIYERPDIQIGEGRYRLRLMVGGDKLTELTHFVKIPEAFSRRYEEMRSANDTLASAAYIGIAILYVLGGCIIGIFFLLRQRWIIWRKALFWGMFIASLQVLTAVNYWPLEWMYYDTALSSKGFLSNQIVQLFIIFLSEGLLLTLTFIAAESLSRKAFPEHIQLWRLWSPEVASSPAVLGRTTTSYLLIGWKWTFVIVFYFFTTKVLGWWTPSGTLFHPDILATYFPWLTSIAVSLHAGFWEECLFRAIPIAGAAIIGEKLGHRRAWIIGAFIIQALIFGAAHANYAQQPAYARMVELFIPSLFWGGLYLYFGLLPGIILHFIFDVSAIALPLFVSSAPGTRINQVIVVILALVPLWIIILSRLRAGRWNEIKEEHYNRSWQPPEKVEPEKVSTPEFTKPLVLSHKITHGIIIAGLLGLGLWFFATDFKNYAPPISITRSKAQESAKQILNKRGIELQKPWKTLSNVVTPLGQDDRFVWQTGSKEDYKSLMGKYLPAPVWKIRFAKFEGDVAERAEEYQLFITNERKILRFIHRLPEARPGISIEEEEARKIAHSVLNTKYRLEPAKLEEISAEPSQLPSRRDWSFTFKDTLNYPLKEGEARIGIEIAGDEVVDSYRYIYVPEEWARKERDRRNLTGILRDLCGVIVSLFILASIACAIVSWSRKKFSVKVFLGFFALLLGVQIAGLINGWPSVAAGFSTAEPLKNQIFTIIAFSMLTALFTSAGIALIIGFLQNKKAQPSKIQDLQTILSGFSLGALTAGISAVISKFAPSMKPYWAEYSNLNNYIPALGVGLTSISGYITASVLFLLIFKAADYFTQSWTKRKVLFSIIFILSGIIIAGNASIDNIMFWLLSGTAIGIILLLAYIFILRFQLALIPLAVSTSIILEELKQGILYAYPQSIYSAVLAITLVIMFSIYWYKKLLKSI